MLLEANRKANLSPVAPVATPARAANKLPDMEDSAAAEASLHLKCFVWFCIFFIVGETVARWRRRKIRVQSLRWVKLPLQLQCLGLMFWKARENLLETVVVGFVWIDLRNRCWIWKNDDGVAYLLILLVLWNCIFSWLGWASGTGPGNYAEHCDEEGAKDHQLGLGLGQWSWKFHDGRWGAEGV